MQSEQKHIIESLAERICDLLCTDVQFLDTSGRIITSAVPYDMDRHERRDGHHGQDGHGGHDGQAMRFGANQNAGKGLSGSAVKDPTTGSGGRRTEFLRIHTSELGEPVIIVIGEPQSPNLFPPNVAYTLVDMLIRKRTGQAEPENTFRERSAFLTELLAAPSVDSRTLLRRAMQLGIDLQRPRIVVRIDIGKYSTPKPRDGHHPAWEKRNLRRVQLLEDTIRQYWPAEADAVCGQISDGSIVVLAGFGGVELGAWANHSEVLAHGEQWANLKSAQRAGCGLKELLESRFGAGFSVGIGRYYPGLAGLAVSYREARVAQEIGAAQPGGSGVYSMDTFGPDIFVWLRERSDAESLAQQLLMPITNQPELLETLDVFFRENCSPVSAAHHLALHRNTLAYRLDKIAGLSGLDPRMLDHAALLRTAMLVRGRCSTTNTAASATTATTMATSSSAATAKPSASAGAPALEASSAIRGFAGADASHRFKT